MVAESEQHQAVTIDWIGRIKGVDGERLIRVYEGKDRVKVRSCGVPVKLPTVTDEAMVIIPQAMLKDLDVYHKVVYGVLFSSCSTC